MSTWPQGVSAAGVASGIKSDGALDFGLLLMDEPAEWAGVFTRNAAAAAPVVWSRARLGSKIRAIAVNSGNANACTGSGGHAAVLATARCVAATIGCGPDEIAVASTGPIGVPLPVDPIIRAVPRAVAEATTEAEGFATAILTTDTAIKTSFARTGPASMVGVGKGAAMLAPNMATMLSFIVTDAALPHKTLQTILVACVEQSFNRICVDACESTNDSVFLVSTGRVEGVNERAIEAAVSTVCGDLAGQMVRDAEGGTRVMRVRVEGAADDGRARALARAVAASDLWRAAAHGADPNWGRVLSAAGAQDRDLDMGVVELHVGAETVFSAGEPSGSRDAAAKAMAADDFDVVLVVGSGPGAAEVLAADLSPEYVALNACGTS